MVLGGPSWEPKPMKYRSKFAIQDGVPFGIDFKLISMRFWSQDGRGNLDYIDQNSS